ncbi:hypothetical protein BASA81_008293 [Batrachochytrium salamandrivorans]|nr:hypothetical protein BASA81_008293 [Batrachochytrium salamandrivorans]
MKVTLTFEGDSGSAKMSLKLDLPVKWMDGPISRVVDTFVSQYNKKHSTTPLADVHVIGGKEGLIVPLDSNVGQVTSHLGPEFLIKKGKRVPEEDHLHEEEEEEEEVDVTTKKGLEKAKTHAFDYSKWDKLDLSDDDGLDCHPNIELASWKRIKAQQRAERRQKEDAEVKRLQAKIDEYAKDGNQPHLLAKYQTKLAEFEKTRKWVAEDVCDTKEDRSVVPKDKPKPTPTVGPVNPDQEFFETYEDFVHANEPLLRKFADLDSRQASQEFLESHPQLLHQHSDGFLLLLCLDVAMKNASNGGAKGKRELKRVVQQHLLLNYILELAKLSKLEDVRAAVRPFFAKTANQSKEQAQEFDHELNAFISRIENRAKEKLEKGEKSPLAPKLPKPAEEEEEEFEKAEVGPGGLDPTEVLQSLPADMQQAFVDQDVPKLKAILAEMDHGDASYHLQRCIDSGLWVVPPKQPGEKDESDEEE